MCIHKKRCMSSGLYDAINANLKFKNDPAISVKHDKRELVIPTILDDSLNPF